MGCVQVRENHEKNEIKLCEQVLKFHTLTISKIKLVTLRFLLFSLLTRTSFKQLAPIM